MVSKMWFFKRAKSSVEGGEILVGEEEKNKINFSMMSKVFGKLGFPVNSLRVTDSANVSSANTNIVNVEAGVAQVDHSHVANSIIAAPAPKKEPFSYKALEQVKKTLSWSKKIMARGPAGGRLR